MHACWWACGRGLDAAGARRRGRARAGADGRGQARTGAGRRRRAGDSRTDSARSDNINHTILRFVKIRVSKLVYKC